MERTERLFNLVLALLSASTPLTRATIRSVVGGYADSASDAAFERMFERDKDDLRALGIPVDTVTTEEGEVLGYLIPRDDYRLPPIRFTQAQWSLLGVAARAWSQATAADPARRALRKLEAADARIADPGAEFPARVARDVTWQARPRAGEQWLPALWGAIRRRCRVVFDYRGLRDGSPVSRTIEPWSVLGRDGGWYLIGRDVDRGEPRVFRLSRIIGAPVVEASPGSFAIPDHDGAAMLDSVALPQDSEGAWVAIAPGAGTRLRLGASEPPAQPPPSPRAVPRGFDVIYLGPREHGDLATDIAALGDRAFVVHPPALAERVRELLERVADAHTDPMTGAAT